MNHRRHRVIIEILVFFVLCASDSDQRPIREQILLWFWILGLFLVVSAKFTWTQWLYDTFFCHRKIKLQKRVASYRLKHFYWWLVSYKYSLQEWFQGCIKVEDKLVHLPSSFWVVCSKILEILYKVHSSSYCSIRLLSLSHLIYANTVHNLHFQEPTWSVNGRPAWSQTGVHNSLYEDILHTQASSVTQCVTVVHCVFTTIWLFTCYHSDIFSRKE